MSHNLDIIDIDTKIRSNFKDEEIKILFYKEKLDNIKKTLEIKNIRPRILNNLLNSEKELGEHIHDIENNLSINFYITETAFLLEKYKEILNKPIKMNFMGKATKNNKFWSK